MRKYCALAMVLLFAAGGAAWAQSSKATAQVGDISVLGVTASGDPDGFTTILSNTVHTSKQKDLFVDVSLECGLTTRTLVKSKGGTKDTATADASVEVRVLVDGTEAMPGRVTFCKRYQELSATFQGLIDGCLSIDELGNIVLDETCLEPEELELVLDTMSANSFNFLYDDAGVGSHTIEVQARISLDSSAGEGSAEARATLGKGSMTVEEVRLVAGEDIEM